MNLFAPVVNELIKRKVPFTYSTSYDKDPFLVKKLRVSNLNSSEKETRLLQN